MLTTTPDLLGRLAERQNQSPITMPGYRKGKRPGNYGRTFPPVVLSREEIELLLRHMGRGPTGHRNRALVVMTWRTALRISEALALRPTDVDAATLYPTVTVQRGKGGKRRQVAVDGYALAYLDRWLTERKRLGLDYRQPIFCVIDRRSRGKPLYSSYVREMLKERAAQAGIDKPVRPHGLRHSRAFEMMMEGAPLGVIRAQLGHVDLATTMRYCDHLGAAEAIKWVHDHSLPPTAVGPGGSASSPPHASSGRSAA